MRMLLILGVGVVSALVSSTPASAANGMAPRTPPVFPLERCLSVVDRSVDPLFTLDYAIPFEDSALTPDELEDSRRFQFFGFCEDAVPALRPLPDWTSMSDVQRSLSAGLIEEAPPGDDVLDAASSWRDCAQRINADDARVPITCAATEGGMTWDTTGLAAGNYVIRGYTFEPSVNVWTARRGVVQIRDGAEPLPVVSLMSPALEDQVVRTETGYRILGCADGPSSTQVELQWASLIQLGGDDDESVWETFSTVDIADGSFDVLFEPPDAAVNQPVMVRGVATGPSGRRWVSYAIGSLVVLAGDGESDDATTAEPLDWCGFYDDVPSTDTEGETGTEAGGDGTDGGSSSSTDSGEPGEDEPASGCGCRASHGPSGALLFVLALGLGRRRRLRRSGGRAAPQCATVTPLWPLRRH